MQNLGQQATYINAVAATSIEGGKGGARGEGKAGEREGGGDAGRGTADDTMVRMHVRGRRMA